MCAIFILLNKDILLVISIFRAYKNIKTIPEKKLNYIISTLNCNNNDNRCALRVEHWAY